VNLAELYFESLEGIGNPARFTPMNDDVRREFRALGGVDPIDLFGEAATVRRKSSFWITAPSWPGGWKRSGWPCSRACAAKSRIWTWC